MDGKHIKKIKPSPFKVKDKVWCCLLGKGRVVEIEDNRSNYPIKVNFEGSTDYYYYTLEGRLYKEAKPTLSFTTYEFVNFTQKRPKEKAKDLHKKIKKLKPGTPIFVTDSHSGDDWNIKVFKSFNEETNKVMVVDIHNDTETTWNYYSLICPNNEK